jgi:hypothetical protein
VTFVNDGVCDCCDGSDEQTTECPDRCDAHAQKAKEALAQKARGMKRRLDYVAKGKKWAREHSKTLEGGPDMAFLALAEICLKKKLAGYSYKVCPYRSVSQCGGTGGCVKVAEAQYRWKVKHTVMHMGGGKACPGGLSRQATLEFECTDGADSIIAVGESENCHYVFRIASPAACTI